MKDTCLTGTMLAGCWKMGCAEGQSPFAGSLRVSLRYNFFSFLYRKESEEGQEEFFRSLLVEKTSASLNSYG